MMRLSPFILDNMEPILAEWEQFAATLLPAADTMNALALRDHARQILEAIAADLETVQSRQAQMIKAKGQATSNADGPDTAAETHALLRARCGFDINQLVAEYRALRASVLRLYLDAHQPAKETLADVIRFDEAVDQAICESVTFFAEQVDAARNLLLGALGHDMRSPLNSILMTASYLSAMNAGETVSAAASRLIRSGSSIKSLLDDLVDFNRTQLGLGIKIESGDADVATVLNDEVEQCSSSHTDRHIDVAIAGDTTGCWDRRRLQQMIRNLIMNALTYGTKDDPVKVVLTGTDTDILFEVRNKGATLDPALLTRIFEPLQRGLHQSSNSHAVEGMGLGLFIVQEIVRGHGGEVVARSVDGETSFSVRLPRKDPRAGAAQRPIPPKLRLVGD